MTKLKICGITREADACFAARAGADFLGLIFVPDSPRAVTAARALAIGEAVRSTGSAARLVGVFRNAAREEVMRNAVDARLDFVQLHGNEDDDFLRTLPVPVIKTVHVGEERPDFAGFPSATWLLFDTLHDRLAGGTGSRFDWSLLAGSERGQPFFLAGGITPENVAAAVAVVHPDAIDVSSGVESAPGIKDPAKIELLVRAIQSQEKNS